MTKEELAKIIEKINGYTGEKKQAALDALNNILQAKSPKPEMPPMPPGDPIDIDLDPDLDNPYDEFPSEDQDDVDIEDPDHVLDDMDNDGDNDNDDGDDGDDSLDEPDEEDGDDKVDGKDKPDTEDDGDDGEEEDGKNKKDGKGSKDKKGKKSKKGDRKSGEDEDGEEDPTLEDAETEEKGKHEKFRRKVTTSRISKVLEKAEAAAEKEAGEDGDFGDVGEIAGTEGEPTDSTDGDTKDKKASAKAKIDKIKELKEKLAETIEKYIEDEKSASETIAEATDFDKEINEILDEIDKLGADDFKISKDIEARVAEIKAENDDFEANRELDQEDEANIQTDPDCKKRKAREDEAKKINQAVANLEPLSTFEISFERAIKEQAEFWEREYYNDLSYSREDRHHEDDDLATGVEFEDERWKFEKEMPIVDVYIDQSGSWGDSDVTRALKAVSVINKYVYDPDGHITGKVNKEGCIKLNTWYFSEILSQDRSAARSRRSQECWDWCIDQINAAPKTKNVVFITDRDIDVNYGTAGHYGAIYGNGTTVEGCVWIIWKNKSIWGRGSQEGAPSKLQGKIFTKQYALWD